jgi:hypothetical protein
LVGEEVVVDGGAERLTMDGPVACVIRVRGALTPVWSAHLRGLAITPVDGPGAVAAATTELRGELRGQAALLDVLRALHTQGLPVLSVACVPARRPPTDDGGDLAAP